MFSGCGTDLVTPFRRDLSVDEQAVRRLVRRQIDAGINFLVPCGTTGESPTLSREEMLRFARLLGEARSAVFVWSMGITQHRDGVENVRAIVDLALARGFIGREKCGLMEEIRVNALVHNALGSLGDGWCLAAAFAASCLP